MRTSHTSAGPALPDEQWSIDDLATWRGVAPATIRSYLARDQLPAPDGRVGKTPWWWKTTITATEPPANMLANRWGDPELDGEFGTTTCWFNQRADAGAWGFLAPLGAATLLHDPGTPVRYHQHPESLLPGTEIGISTAEMSKKISSWAQNIVNADLGRRVTCEDKTVPVLAARWPRLTTSALATARAARIAALEELAGTAPELIGLLAGLGEPHQLWEPQTKTPSLGISRWDCSDTRRGETLLTHSLVPAATAITTMDLDDINAALINPHHGPTAPWKRTRWGTWAGQEPVNAVHVLLSITALRLWPVQPCLNWSGATPAGITTWHTPGHFTLPPHPNPTQWCAIPTPRPQKNPPPATITDWLNIATTPHATPHIAQLTHQREQNHDTTTHDTTITHRTKTVAWSATRHLTPTPYHHTPTPPDTTPDTLNNWAWTIFRRHTTNTGKTIDTILQPTHPYRTTT